MNSFVDVSISPQLQIGLSESGKPCLNLCYPSRLRSSFSVVSNLTPFGLWNLKTLFPEGRINFESFFLKIFRFSDFHIFWFRLFHSVTTEGKKGFWLKIMFYIELRNIISISRIVCLFWRLLPEYFKAAAQFPVPSSFSSVSTPSYW